MKEMKSTVMLMSFAASLCLVACGDDDDNINDNNSNTFAPVGVLDPSTGLRLKSVGGNHFYNYDANGQLDYIDYNINGFHQRWEFTYNPNKIILHSNGSEMVYSVTYNNAGYLLRLDGTGERVYYGSRGKVTLNEFITFDYDTNGHIAKIEWSQKQIRTEHYTISDTWTYNTTYTYTWNNNLLVQEIFEVTYEEGGEDWGTEKETTTYSYTNSAYRNVYHQWTRNIVPESDLALYAYVGLLGTGPNMLPSSSETVEEVTSRGKSKNPRTRNKTYTYGFNADGSVSYYDDGDVYHSYEHVSY